MKSHLSSVASLLLLSSAVGIAWAEDRCELGRKDLRYRALQMSCDEVRATAQAYVSRAECDVLKTSAEQNARQTAATLSCDQLKEKALAEIQRLSCGDLFAQNESDCRMKRENTVRQIRKTPCSELRKGLLAEMQKFSCEQIRWVMIQKQDAASCKELRDELVSLTDSSECQGLTSLQAAWATREPATGSFVTLTLPEGLEIKIPKSWSLIVGDYKRELDNMVQRTLDLSGIAARTGTLVSASSPRSTAWAYAEVRVAIENTYSQTQVRNLTPSDIAAYDVLAQRTLETMLQNLGGRILKWYGTRRDSISGHTCLISEYRRSEPSGGQKIRPEGGPVRGQIVYFPLGSRSVSLTLSYTDLGDPPAWRATVDQIRASFTMKQSILSN